MAQKVSNSTGNWSAAATWDTVTNTPTIHATSNVSVSAGGITSATFTAPSITDQSTGVLVWINAVGTAGTLVATLQENSAGWVDVAGATGSITITTLTASNWFYFRWTTPYTFAAVTADYYRVKLNTSGASGTTGVALNSAGTAFAYLHTDNRTGVPASTDDCWIAGQNNSTTITVTMDGTQTCGSGTDTVEVTTRSVGNGLSVVAKGVLAWDAAASATLTVKGNISVQAGGDFRMGTVASPYPTAKVATLKFNENGTSGNFGMKVVNGGKCTMQGEAKSSTSLYKTKYSSGSGTTASPLITADAVDWAVNDEILVGATSDNATNYNETEKKFIKTKNSSTSYVLSDTAGGAESGLSNTHTTDAWILNITRNVVLDSTTTTEGYYFQNISTTAGDVDIDWTRFNAAGGSTTAGKQGIFPLGRSVTTSTGACDYSVCYGNVGRGFCFFSSKTVLTFTGLISGGCISASNVGGFYFTTTPNNKTFTDCFAINNGRMGWEVDAMFNTTFNTCYAISNNKSAASAYGGWWFNNCGKLTFTNCETHANRVKGIYLQNATDLTFNNYLSGSKGTTFIDIDIVADAYFKVVFNNSNFSSATFINNYLNSATGSELTFHNLNDTTNNHIWYTDGGTARSTGAGLSDTTIRTTGSLGVRIAPEDSTNGFTWSFLIPAKANSIVNFYGFFQKNAAFGTDTAKVELWLPQSTSADDTFTLANNTNWQACSLSANNTLSVDEPATIKVVGLTTTASAYLYCDDFYNAGDTVTSSDKVTGLDTWDKGKPIGVIQPTATSAADIWTFSTNNLTTVSTTGRKLVDDLTVAKFLALKD